MQIGMMFDATQHEPAGFSSQLPLSDSKGWPVIVSESEMKETKAKDGSGFLELTFRVIEGEHTGSEGKYRINLFNKNEKAVEIAYKQLSALCYVTNVMQVADSAQLHNIPFRAVVGLQKRPVDWKEGDPEFTEIKGVLDINGNQPGKSGGAAAPQQAPSAPPVPPQQAAGTFPIVDTPPVNAQAPAQTPAPSATAWAQNPAGNTTKPAWQK